MTLLWAGSGNVPPLELRALDTSWSVEIGPSLETVSGVLLDWREAQIPLSAAQGMAELRLLDGRRLAQIPIDVIPVLTTPPTMGQSVDADFSGVGKLAGYTLDSLSVNRGDTPRITLVWQAGDTIIHTDYTVFVQMLDANGAVIAQSDYTPAEGLRPTSGWRSGEYVIDIHWLTFNASAHPGEATLQVGLYDPNTNRRVLLADGGDAIVLPDRIFVR